MQSKAVKVPSALLFDHSLSAYTKVVWMAASLHESIHRSTNQSADRRSSLSPTRLARLTGFSRPTVRTALKQLTSAGWEPRKPGQRPSRRSRDVWVTVPSGLVTDQTLSPHAKVIFAVLVAQSLGRDRTHGLREAVGVPVAPSDGSTRQAEPVDDTANHPAYPGGGSGHTVRSNGMHEQTVRPEGGATEPEESRPPGVPLAYASLSKSTGWSIRTVRQAVRELAQGGWLRLSQAHRRAALYYSVADPRLAASIAELHQAKRRLARAKYLGEALMREYLTLIVDSDEFEDDASPGFLVNPLTGERMQLDRYYPPNRAFEFNGPQHYGPTEKYPSTEELVMQQVRDYIKIGICATRGITVRIVHPEDLSLAGMLEIVGDLLPLRDMSHDSPRITFLESVARSYRRACRRASRLAGETRPQRPETRR